MAKSESYCKPRLWQQVFVSMTEVNGENVVVKPVKQRDKPMAARKVEKSHVAVPMDFNELCERANQGDPEAQAELSRVLDTNPAIWRRLGDLAAHAQLEFTRLIGKGDFLLSECVKRRADEMRKELAGPSPTPLELLAVERIVAAWLQVQHVEAQIVVADGEISKAKFWLQRQLQANRLYHAATKSLLLIRDLLPKAAEPSALVKHETPLASINGKGRLAVCAASRQQKPAPLLMNRICGTKNGRRRNLATI